MSENTVQLVLTYSLIDILRYMLAELLQVASICILLSFNDRMVWFIFHGKRILLYVIHRYFCTINNDIVEPIDCTGVI